MRREWVGLHGISPKDKIAWLRREAYMERLQGDFVAAQRLERQLVEWQNTIAAGSKGDTRP